MVRFIFIIVLLLTQFNTTFAFSKIVYVDMNKIISSSVSGLSILKQLNELSKKNSKNYKKKEESIKDKEKKIISQKNILSEEDFIIKVNKLKTEIKEYNEDRNNSLKDFDNIKINNTNKFLKLINPILLKYSEDNSISIILQKKDLVVGKNELDITDKVIKIIDDKIKEFKIN